MTRLVYIVGTGSRTPPGLKAEQAAAALRAGINMMVDHPFMVDQAGEKMPGGLDAEIDPTVMGSARMLLLAEPALKDACSVLAKVRRSVAELPLYLGLPEFRPGFSQNDVDEIQVGIKQFRDLPVPISNVVCFPQGHAAGLAAIAHAAEQIKLGVLDACLAGGVDSYFHPDTMEWLDANLQLAGSVSRSSFVPGEGGGFCLLLSDTASNRLGIEPLARVRAIANGKESKLIKTDEMCFGEGLSTVVSQALGCFNLPEERINNIYCDINGERYRGEEWGFVCLRLSNNFDDPVDYISPADTWGDMGAASAPLFLILACNASARGYSKGPRTMIWTSSEHGLRAAAVIETPVKISGEGRMS